MGTQWAEPVGPNTHLLLSPPIYLAIPLTSASYPVVPVKTSALLNVRAKGAQTTRTLSSKEMVGGRSGMVVLSLVWLRTMDKGAKVSLSPAAPVTPQGKALRLSWRLPVTSTVLNLIKAASF